MMKRTTIIEIVTVLNIILFLYTGIVKIMDYNIFKQQLTDSPILGFAAKPVTVFLPVVEFIVVVLLAIPRWRLKGLYSSLALLLAFTAYIIAMFIVSPQMPCSCGGIIELLSWKQHVIFNTVLIIFDIWTIWLMRKHKQEALKQWNEVVQYHLS